MLRGHLATLVLKPDVLKSAVLMSALLLPGCATNPATGKQQLMLYSESEEVELGRRNDRQILAELGLYPDPELATYVQDLGARLAADSERPELPWSFRVLDDPVVNAFALPGGFIYVTRGILGHLSSEAELAGVLGHEIGHVTARHSMNQLSKQQLAGIGLGLGAAVAPEIAGALGDIAGTSLGLLFLKHGRDDERQADELGVRYISRTGYPPAALGAVFAVLSRSSDAQGGDRLPGWLSTHPEPEERIRTLKRRLPTLSPELAQATWREAPYLDQLEGLTFGKNPREGYFDGDTFFHPDLAFRLDLPFGWDGRNLRDALVVTSPKRDALFVLTLDTRSSASDASRAFFADNEIAGGGRWLPSRAPLVSESRTFRALSGGTELQGGVAFAEHGGRVYRLLAYSRETGWPGYETVLADVAASFSPVKDKAVLGVEPLRIELVTTDREMSWEEFDRRYPSAVPLATLQLINHAEPGDRVAAGRRVKRVVGRRVGGE